MIGVIGTVVGGLFLAGIIAIVTNTGNSVANPPPPTVLCDDNSTAATEADCPDPPPPTVLCDDNSTAATEADCPAAAVFAQFDWHGQPARVIANVGDLYRFFPLRPEEGNVYTFHIRHQSVLVADGSQVRNPIVTPDFDGSTHVMSGYNPLLGAPPPFAFDFIVDAGDEFEIWMEVITPDQNKARTEVEAYP
jgi:hypothetical protein